MVCILVYNSREMWVVVHRAGWLSRFCVHIHIVCHHLSTGLYPQLNTGCAQANVILSIQRIPNHRHMFTYHKIKLYGFFGLFDRMYRSRMVFAP